MDILNDFQLEDNAEQGAELVLLNPVTGKQLSETVDGVEYVTIVTMRGTDSPTFDTLTKDENVLRLVGGEDFDEEASILRICAGLIMGWKNVHDGDKELVYSKENAIKLMKRPWILKQCRMFAETRSNFFLSSLETKKKS